LIFIIDFARIFVHDSGEKMARFLAVVSLFSEALASTVRVNFRSLCRELDIEKVIVSEDLTVFS